MKARGYRRHGGLGIAGNCVDAEGQAERAAILVLQRPVEGQTASCPSLSTWAGGQAGQPSHSKALAPKAPRHQLL